MESEKICLGSRKKALPLDILYLQADQNYTYVFFKDGKSFLSSTNLKKLETRLQHSHFVRASRSALISLDFILKYELLPNSGIVYLKNQQTVMVSRRRCKSIGSLLKIKSLSHEN